jgi:hypothetical protein
MIAYEPDQGFTGTDSLTVDIVYPSKSTVRRHYAISVNPPREASVAPPSPPAIVEVSRVAAADQQLQVAFLYDMNPDCSVIGMPTVHIMEQPQSGKVTVENGTGFPTFPASNTRFKCNSTRSDGVVISYTPNPGYTGHDSVMMEIIYPDGNAAKRRYAIDVR